MEDVNSNQFQSSDYFPEENSQNLEGNTRDNNPQYDQEDNFKITVNEKSFIPPIQTQLSPTEKSKASGEDKDKKEIVTKSENDKAIKFTDSTSEKKTTRFKAKIKALGDQRDLVFKVIVVGEPSVGKTSMVHRYTYGNFATTYKATIGVDFSRKDIKYDSNTNITLHIWDLAGQERLNAVVRAYFRDTNVALCVCDVTNSDTLDKLTTWIETVKEKSTTASGTPTNPICMLVVNKMDNYDLAKIAKNLFTYSTNNVVDDPLVSKPINNNNDNNNNPFENGKMIVAHNSMGNTTLDSMSVGEQGYNKQQIQKNIEKWCEEIQPRLDQLAKHHGFSGAIAISVMYNVNVSKLFRMITAESVKRYEASPQTEDDEADALVALQQENTVDNAGRSYCSGYC